jgi:flagellar motor switch protein FliN/FliY
MSDPMGGMAPEPQAAPLNELAGMGGAAGSASLDTLLDVSLPVAIEFGRTSMTVQEVLELGTGSVIQLSRMVGEPIDIFVSDRKLAEGEVVVVGEHFGVRITRILPTGDRAA